MAKKQRSIGAESNDRFLIIVSDDTGKRIRKLANKKNETFSRFLAEIIESKLDKLEEEAE